MSWTVACFCGNVYTTPPDECNVCHRTVADVTAQAAASLADLSTHAPTSTRRSHGCARTLIDLAVDRPDSKQRRPNHSCSESSEPRTGSR